MGELANAVDSYRRWLDDNDQDGETTLSVSCELVGGTEATVSVGRHTINVDEPKMLGGRGTAPNPVGYLLAAIGSCSAIGLSVWSDILEIPFDSAQVLVEGDIHAGGVYGFGEETDPSFSAVRMEIRVSGSEPKKRYEELVGEVQAHSPLLGTISNPIPVTTSLVTG